MGEARPHFFDLGSAAPGGVGQSWLAQRGEIERCVGQFGDLLQHPLPVGQTEDLGAAGLCVEPHRGQQQGVGPNSVIPGDPLTTRVNPRVSIQAAWNPFDFWPLIEGGFAEWSLSADALINGAPFPGALDLFRGGLGNGSFDLFLGFVDLAKEPSLLAFVQEAVPFPFPVAKDESFAENLSFDGKVEQGADTGGLAELVPGQPGGLDAGKWVGPREPAGLVLIDIVSVFHGFLQGHLLWVAPEYRGRGLVGGYFDAALDVARRHGLKGFVFLSTLPFWERRAPRYGFVSVSTIEQGKGPAATLWVRRV